MTSILTRKEKLEYIAENYMQAMWQKAYGVLSDAYEAEDACQESFIKLIGIIDEIEDPKEMRVLALCRVIARNTAVDIARKKSRAVPVEELYPEEDSEPVGGSPEETAIEAAGQEELAQAIASLPENYRDVLRLRCLYDFSARKTAELMGITENNVHIRLNRARKMLRERLKQCRESVSVN